MPPLECGGTMPLLTANFDLPPVNVCLQGCASKVEPRLRTPRFQLRLGFASSSMNGAQRMPEGSSMDGR